MCQDKLVKIKRECGRVIVIVMIINIMSIRVDIMELMVDIESEIFFEII
jgi:hypothetical protein